MMGSMTASQDDQVRASRSVDIDLDGARALAESLRKVYDAVAERIDEDNASSPLVARVTGPSGDRPQRPFRRPLTLAIWWCGQRTKFFPAPTMKDTPHGLAPKTQLRCWVPKASYERSPVKER